MEKCLVMLVVWKIQISIYGNLGCSGNWFDTVISPEGIGGRWCRCAMLTLFMCRWSFCVWLSGVSMGRYDSAASVYRESVAVLARKLMDAASRGVYGTISDIIVLLCAAGGGVSTSMGSPTDDWVETGRSG